MYVVVGVRFEKAWCGAKDEKAFNFLRKLPKEIILDGALLKEAEEEASNDLDDIKEAYDDYGWDLARLSQRSKYTKNLDLKWFFSCDEESAIFGVELFDIDECGTNTLSEVVNSISSEEARVGKELMFLFDSWGIFEYVIETYLISDW